MSAPDTALPARIGASLDERASRRAGAHRASAARSRGDLVRRSLLLADVVGLALACVLTELLRGSAGAADDVPLSSEFLLLAATLPAWIAGAKLYRLYEQDEERADHTTLEDLPGVFHLMTVGTFLLMAGTWATALPNPHVGKLITFWGLSIALITVTRSSARAVCRRSPSYIQNTIVVGAGDIGQLVARKLRLHDEYGMNFLGFVDADPRELRPDLDGARVLGTPDSLPDLVRRLNVERVVIAFWFATSTCRSTSCRACSRASGRTRGSTPWRACR
jgi:FlaA1/EpsC-like NDP-sugar epimerase